MSHETLHVEREGAVIVITLNRPERLNAINGTMHKELFALWREIKSDNSVRSMVFTGAGDRAFCSGADMKERGEAYARGEHIERDRVDNTLVPRVIELSGFAHQHSQHDIWKPMVCALNGTCAGGGNAFVGDADIVLAVPDMYFMEPHVSVGMVPAGEMQSLVGRVPWGTLPWLAYQGTKARLSAQRAYQLGLVNELVPREQLLSRAITLANWLAVRPSSVVQARKQMLWESRYGKLRENLDRGSALAQAIESGMSHGI